MEHDKYQAVLGTRFLLSGFSFGFVFNFFIILLLLFSLMRCFLEFPFLLPAFILDKPESSISDHLLSHSTISTSTVHTNSILNLHKQGCEVYWVQTDGKSSKTRASITDNIKYCFFLPFIIHARTFLLRLCHGSATLHIITVHHIRIIAVSTK